MAHKCYIEGGSAACFDVDGELWVKEYSDEFQREGREYKVAFCPQCGFQIPVRKDSFFSGYIPAAEIDDSIHKFSSELAKSIAEMNHNVESIKAFMISQNCQNELFLDKQKELEKRITSLETNELPY